MQADVRASVVTPLLKALTASTFIDAQLINVIEYAMAANDADEQGNERYLSRRRGHHLFINDVIEVNNGCLTLAS